MGVRICKQICLDISCRARPARLYFLWPAEETDMPDKPPEHGTRIEIIRFIKVKGRACIREISRALCLTPMGVRRHLDRLQRLGMIRAERQRGARGRPADVWLLTELGDSLFPKTYDRFSVELIRSVASLDGPQKVNLLFEQRREHLLERFAGRMKGKGRKACIQEAVAILCEEGYMAEFRQLRSHSFLITEHNCAIAQVAREYPQACEAELCFLGRMLQADVERQAHALKGDLECSYLVRFPARRNSAP